MMPDVRLVVVRRFGSRSGFFGEIVASGLFVSHVLRALGVAFFQMGGCLGCGWFGWRWLRVLGGVVC